MLAKAEMPAILAARRTAPLASIARPVIFIDGELHCEQMLARMMAVEVAPTRGGGVRAEPAVVAAARANDRCVPNTNSPFAAGGVKWHAVFHATLMDEVPAPFGRHLLQNSRLVFDLIKHTEIQSTC